MRPSLPDGGSGDLSSAKVPWYLSTRFLRAHAAFVATLAIALVLLEWKIRRVPPSPVSAIMFALGAGIGLIGIPSMVEMMQAAGPYTKLREEFTQGRFFTLACPMLSPRYWRAVRELKRTLQGEGIPPGPTAAKQLLALAPLGLAVSAGWAARLWLNAPADSSALAFLGCMLTWGDLSAMLSRRRVQEQR